MASRPQLATVRKSGQSGNNTVQKQLRKRLLFYFAGFYFFLAHWQEKWYAMEVFMRPVVWLHDFLWGIPGLVLLIGTGAMLSIRLGLPQIRLFPQALRRLTKDASSDGGISARQSLFTALAGTVGTGNLVGVAGAICLGGPGSVFWMWVCGILAMATKYAEAALAVHFRVGAHGQYLGGTMYTISRGMKPQWQPMAKLYAILGLIAALGVGTTVQMNAVVSGFHSLISFGNALQSMPLDFLLGILCAGAFLLVAVGGVKRIARASSCLVPLAAGGYILLCLVFLASHFRRIPGAFHLIFAGAFHPAAFTGGTVAGALQVISVGCRRGVFSNEAGMGTASMAHAAGSSCAVEQGTVGLMEVFLDTLVICSLTALVVLTSGVRIPFGSDSGAELLFEAFASFFGCQIQGILVLIITCLSFATMICWGLYGKQCICFLFGSGAEVPACLMQTAGILMGAVTRQEMVWYLAETANGLMMIPNLLTLIMLSGRVKILTKEFLSGGSSAMGGKYADFNQCKPL